MVHAGLTFIFDRLSAGAPAEEAPPSSSRPRWMARSGSIPPEGVPRGQLSTVGIETSLANWSESSEIPRSVIDAFLQPKSTSIRAYGAGGINGYIEAVLTVDPTQVPEPATWLAWTVSGLGALVIQKQRRNKGSQRELTVSR